MATACEARAVLRWHSNMVGQMFIRKWLILKANGDCRMLTRMPRLSWDEIAFRLIIKAPNTWGQVAAKDLKLTIPESDLAPVIEVGDTEQPDFKEVMEQAAEGDSDDG